MSFPIHVPGGGGGISQLTGGVVAGPGSGSVAANTAALTKTVDCTNAGVAKPSISITAFDGTYATVSGLGATGALISGATYEEITPSLYGPALGGGTFSGASAGVSAFDGVHTATITGLNNMFPGIVGGTITFSGAASGGNNGTFTVSAYISSSSIQVNNSGAVAPDSDNGAISWTITTGTTANITAFANPQVTITGLSGITASMVGKLITFTGFGNGSNIGSFQITSFISSSSVQVQNASAVSPDSGATWSIQAGELDGLTLSLTVDPATLGHVANITNNEGLFEIQTTAPNSLVTGNVVFISGVNGTGPVTNVEGVQTVTVLDSTHFTIQGVAFSQGNYVNGGVISSGPSTLLLNAATNAASNAAFFAAIHSEWPTVTASLGTGQDGPNTVLILTGTTLGVTGYIGVGAGTANGVLALFENSTSQGSPGISVGGQTPTALTLSNFSNPGNNGTFVVHTWIDSATVTVLNPAAATPDSGTHAVFSTEFYNDILSGALYGPALSGSAATITNFTTPLVTVGGLTGMTPAIVGQAITFASGFTNSANLGSFVVTGYISASSITINNPSGVSPDSGGVWSVPAGHLDGTTLIITVNAGSPLTLTLNGSTNAASMAAFFAAIEATWTTLVATPNPTQGSLVLTETSVFGPNSSIVFGGGTANNYLGSFGTWLGVNSNASFAISLLGGSTPITGASVLELTGVAVGNFSLYTQGAGAFRCQVENATNTSATFASANTPSVAPSESLAVSSDGTVVNPDTPAPGEPPAYIVTAYNQDISGGTAQINVDPNVPFTTTLTGSPSEISQIILEFSNSPFYGLVSNQASQPATVNNNGSFTLPLLLGKGETRLVMSDGSSGMWSIPTVTEDNGRVKRYEDYYSIRASTAANMSCPTNLGADLVWGTAPAGSPFTNGVAPPYVDGSFDTGQADVLGGSDQLSSSANAGADIAVLGNVLYMCGFSDGAPNICAFSIANGSLFAEASVPTGSYLPTTLIAFKEASDPSEAVGGPTDCLFFVTATTVGTLALQANSNNFATNFNFSGSWPNSRGILILGNDGVTTVAGNTEYSSIGIWTDPNNGIIWGADVATDQIGATELFNSGGGPRAICLNRETENFWVAFDGSSNIQYLNVNRQVGQNLALTTLSTFNYPGGMSAVDDLLFDGAFLWALDAGQGVICQMTTNGILVNALGIQTESGDGMTLSLDSRLYCDGHYVYVTGIQRNNQTSAIAKLSPSSGKPVEFFNFPTFSTRGMAFSGNDVFVATAPTINTNVSTVNQGSTGTIATAVGGFADFQDPSANWSSGVVGDWIYIQNASYTYNNGFFLITSWTSSTDITINNFSADTSSETNNGSLSWQMYGATVGIQRLSAQPPGVDFGTLVSIIQTPAVAGWTSGLRLGARVVEYTDYGGPTTFNLNVKPLPGTRVLFVDKDGNAGLSPLTISVSATTINGQTQCILGSPYGYIELEWNGSLWLIVRQSQLAGLQSVFVSNGSNVLSYPQSAAPQLVIDNGGVSSSFSVQSALTPVQAAGCLYFIRNTTSFDCTFGFNGGGTVNLTAVGSALTGGSASNSALVTSDGSSAVVLMYGA